MSCFSRLLGLICALVPGLLFLAFSVRFVQLWPDLGYVTGPLYSLLSFITGAICLYLGVTILFGRDQPEEPATPVNTAPETSAAPVPVASETAEPAPLRAAPLPMEAPTEVPAREAVEPPSFTTSPAPQSIFANTDDAPAVAPIVAPAPVDTPETRIRQLASTRPQWRVTAPQLAQLANLNMGVADATAREMVARGQAQMQTGPNGETVYLFDLADSNG